MTAHAEVLSVQGYPLPAKTASMQAAPFRPLRFRPEDFVRWLESKLLQLGLDAPDTISGASRKPTVVQKCKQLRL